MKKYLWFLCFFYSLVYAAPNTPVSATRIPAEQELVEYTSYMYKQDYTKLTKETQNKIKEE